ncbi:MAG: hypothetical protein ACMXX5_01540, partial [Candidatus Woesearchaeota archaeon]
MGLTQQILEDDDNKSPLGNDGVASHEVEQESTAEQQAKERQFLTDADMRAKAQSDAGKDRLKQLVSEYMPKETY